MTAKEWLTEWAFGGGWVEERIETLLPSLEALLAAEREECAKIPEAMIIGGRAWTQEQAEAAEMLHCVAENIRARGAR